RGCNIANLRRRRGRHRRATRRRHGSGRWGRRRVIISGDGRKIEWSASRAATGSANRSVIASLLRRGDHRLIAEHTRRARCIRTLRRIEDVRTAARIGRRASGSIARIHRRGLRGWRRAASRSKLLEAILGVVLHALELHLELLVTILKILDRAGQLAKRVLHAVEADRKVAGVILGHAARLSLLGRRLALLAAVEQIVEKVSGRAALLRDRRPCHQQGGGKNGRGGCKG